MRKLNKVNVGGRPLQINLADLDPLLEGKTTVKGELVDEGRPRPSERREGWRTLYGRGDDPEAILVNVPLGKRLPKGVSALDSISETLATMNPGRLMEVLEQMQVSRPPSAQHNRYQSAFWKNFVMMHPEQARILLRRHPQLSYALVQALLLNQLVDRITLDHLLTPSHQPDRLNVPLSASASHVIPLTPPVRSQYQTLREPSQVPLSYPLTKHQPVQTQALAPKMSIANPPALFHCPVQPSSSSSPGQQPVSNSAGAAAAATIVSDSQRTILMRLLVEMERSAIVKV